MHDFLKTYGWALQTPIGQDASPRRYYRVVKGGHTAVLMDTAPGQELGDFIRIAKWLDAIGLRAPRIYETDEAGGFLLLEDFGDLSFKKALEQGGDAKALYHKAAEVLKHLWAQKDLPVLPDYENSPVDQGKRRIIDWYVPQVRKEKNPDGLVEEYLKAWEEIERTLPSCRQGFIHGDFHAENLMLLPSGECGILDFQGAMKGPIPYDLGNLLEDARRKVAPDIQQEILQPQDEAFRAWYRVLATQFHARVIGQFIKLALRDNKTGYLAHIPRLEAYINQALADPLLAPLKRFFDDLGIKFNGMTAPAPALIREDAF